MALPAPSAAAGREPGLSAISFRESVPSFAVRLAVPWPDGPSAGSFLRGVAPAPHAGRPAYLPGLAPGADVSAMPPIASAAGSRAASALA